MDQWQSVPRDYQKPDPYGLEDDEDDAVRFDVLKSMSRQPGKTSEQLRSEGRGISGFGIGDDHVTGAAQMMQDYHYPDSNDMWGENRWSDNPNFKHSAVVDAPVLDPHTRQVTVGPQVRHYHDPEKHIERMSNAPGAEGMSADKRRDMIYGHEPVQPFGGSTDARGSDWESTHRPTAEVMRHKEWQSRQPKGTPDPSGYGNIHGAGLYDALANSREDIRSPAHLIIDPSEPIYGDVHSHDAGGFGHDEPVQWEGHHRVATAGAVQKERREAGEADWSVPVPFEVHHGVQNAVSNRDWIQTRSDVADKVFRTQQVKQKIRNMLYGPQGVVGKSPRPKRGTF